MDDATLSFFRTHPERQRCLFRLLGLENMIAADRIVTIGELVEYLDSGDDAAARALLQHVKVRQEHGLMKRAESLGYSTAYLRECDR